MNLEEVQKVGAIAQNSIIHGDCLEVMKDIPDKSIDCIIADLPFGITNCHWDSVIPFEPLWEQYKRIIKPNGAIVLFGSQPFTSALVMSNPKWFKYEWIWDKVKTGNFFLAKIQPLKVHENILVFSGSKTFYSPQMVFSGITDRRKTFNPCTHKTTSSLPNFVKLRAKDNGYRYPRSITKVSNADTSKVLHPTQKPVALLEYLIKTYTQENELILDNTAGSGSLAIAAINTKRNYICIEKDDHYFEVMSERIANHDPNAPAKKSKPKRVPKGQLELF